MCYNYIMMKKTKQKIKDWKDKILNRQMSSKKIKKKSNKKECLQQKKK